MENKGKEVPLFWKISVNDEGVNELLRHAVPTSNLIRVPHPHVTLLYIGGKIGSNAAARNNLDLETFEETYAELKELRDSTVDFHAVAVYADPSIITFEVELPASLPKSEGLPILNLFKDPDVPPIYGRSLIRQPDEDTSITRFLFG
eukprot:GEMP01100713.1.p1 GENE.GEMP01100713.1~~GEMP01100713.1.p1  ORF type:complete len:147 (+),score=31.30 GEMP01100713.1:64-504(+)